MTLDHRRWTTHRNRFDDVGIERSLGEEVRVGDRLRLFAEDFDEDPTDDFSLLLRIGDAFQFAEELLAGVADVPLAEL